MNSRRVTGVNRDRQFEEVTVRGHLIGTTKISNHIAGVHVKGIQKLTFNIGQGMRVGRLESIGESDEANEQIVDEFRWFTSGRKLMSHFLENKRKYTALEFVVNI